MSLIKMNEVITELRCPNGHPSRAFTHHIMAALGKCYCRDCGAELIPMIETVEGKAEYQDYYKCSECGCTVSASWKFCVYCGCKLAAELDTMTRKLIDKEAKVSGEARIKKDLTQ